MMSCFKGTKLSRPPLHPQPTSSRTSTNKPVCDECAQPYDPARRPVYSLPARLFNIYTRKVVRTDNLCPTCLEIARDYLIFSHVWGEPIHYNAKQLGVLGISWTVPLRRREKLDYMIKIAQQWQPRYTWLDVVCMDQSRQDLPQPELVHMHRYYKNAKMCVAVLEDLAAGPLGRLSHTASLEAVEDADRVLRKEFFHVDVAVLPRNEARRILVDMNAVVNAEWFTRVWTFQELGLPRSIEFYSMISEHINAQVLARYGRIANSRRLKYLYQEIDLESTIKKINELRDMRDAAIGSASLKAADVMRLVEKRNARFERDRVFGAISLLPYAHNVDIHGVTELDEAIRRLARAAITAGDYSILAFNGVAQEEPGALWMPSLRLGATFQELGIAETASPAAIRGDGLHVRGLRAAVSRSVAISNAHEIIPATVALFSMTEVEARNMIYGHMRLAPESNTGDVFKLHVELTEKAINAQLGPNPVLLVASKDDAQLLLVASISVNREQVLANSIDCVVLNVNDFAGKVLAILTTLATGSASCSCRRVGYAWLLHSSKDIFDLTWSDTVIS